MLRHNLHVMHIEKKNICDNVLGTLMNIDGKTKDSLNARLDLKEMEIRQELHPREESAKNYNTLYLLHIIKGRKKRNYAIG